MNNDLNVLLIGSGGREHALAWKISRSRRLKKLYAAPGSDAIGKLAERISVDISDTAALISLCRDMGIHLVVVGPEAPLAAGLADALGDAGISVFGPRREAARLEASKSFAKEFMARHRIPTARFETHSDLPSAKAALERFKNGVVVKADGLAGGKGVVVAADRDEAVAALEALMESHAHGGAGKTVVLEERLTGPETTLLGFCDGDTFLPLPPSSDHKRLLDGDNGPNTGGMGVYAPTPEVDEALLARIRKEIINPILVGFRSDFIDYCGILYIGLMLTPQGPRVLEFNVRFGDPETQAVLPLLDSDILDLIEATVRNKLSRHEISWAGSSVCVVLASEGYPESPKTGKTISGLEALDGVIAFHAGTKRGSSWETAGGRVLGLTARAENLAKARDLAYAAAGKIQFDGMQFRRDIGLNALASPEHSDASRV